MQRDNSRTPKAKAQTIERKQQRKGKATIVNQPFKAEMILNRISEHKAFYGSN